jgi:hypothetical protein
MAASSRNRSASRTSDRPPQHETRADPDGSFRPAPGIGLCRGRDQDVDVEVTCSGWEDPDSHRPAVPAFSKDLAAVHAYATLSRRLIDRATDTAANVSQL